MGLASINGLIGLATTASLAVKHELVASAAKGRPEKAIGTKILRCVM